MHLRRLKTPITPKTPAARLYSIYSVHHLGNSEPFQLRSQNVCILQHLRYFEYVSIYATYPSTLCTVYTQKVIKVWLILAMCSFQLKLPRAMILKNNAVSFFDNTCIWSRAITISSGVIKTILVDTSFFHRSFAISFSLVCSEAEKRTFMQMMTIHLMTSIWTLSLPQG